MTSNSPTAADKDELLLSCRYGDIEDVQLFADKYGVETLSGIRDDNGNTVLHMICGNGHADLLDYLLPTIPPSLLSEKNAAQSTPLHWAALNSHLACAQKLVQFPGGPGVDLIDIKNAAGHSPLAEAEFAGWDEGTKWFIEVMNLEAEDVPNEETDEGVRNEAEPALDEIDVTIEDADGQLATMTIDAGARNRPL